MASKIQKSAADALAGLLFDGMTIMSGGFGLCGIPENLIAAIRDTGVKDLTVVSNNCGVDGFGLGILLEQPPDQEDGLVLCGREQAVRTALPVGELELEFNPQGTLAERIRAGGAGIPAFFTAPAYGTLVAEGKETREFDGETYVMERGLTADLSIVKAWKADAEGNLIYPKDRPELQSDDGHGRQASPSSRSRKWSWSAPGQGQHPHARHLCRRLIKGAVRESASSASPPAAREKIGRKMAWTRDQMAARAAKELRTASTSTSASASRPWWPTTSRPACSDAAERERHAGHGPFPL
jgi:3-oxoacid CoA-transferase subunit A